MATAWNIIHNSSPSWSGDNRKNIVYRISAEKINRHHDDNAFYDLLRCLEAR